MSRLPLLLLFFLFNSLRAFQLHPITSYPVVGYKEISFFDESYQRSRRILIWYPIQPGTKGIPSPNLWDVFDIAVDAPISNPQLKKSVIIVSHGYGGSPHQLSWLINKLVYNDCVVLGIQHLDILDGKPQINSWKRAQDVHALLDRFVLQSFANFTDLNRIGFAGFSMGGTTGVWVAGGRSTRLDNFVPRPSDAYPEEFKGIELELPYLDKKKGAQDWKDARIKAAFLMSPAWGWIFDKNDLQKITIPTYIVAPDVDNVLVTANNGGFFQKTFLNAYIKLFRVHLPITYLYQHLKTRINSLKSSIFSSQTHLRSTDSGFNLKLQEMHLTSFNQFFPILPPKSSECVSQLPSIL